MKDDLSTRHIGSPKVALGGIERFEGENGNYFIGIKATNGQAIANSQEYASASGVANGIASVQKNAPDASVVESE